MTTYRLSALLSLIGSIVIIALNWPESIFGLIMLIAGVSAAIGATAAFLLGLPLHRLDKPRPAQVGGLGMSELLRRGLGYFGLLLLVAWSLLVTVSGVWEGRLHHALRSQPDILFSQRPRDFVLLLLVWLAIGLVALRLFFKALKSERSSEA